MYTEICYIPANKSNLMFTSSFTFTLRVIHSSQNPTNYVPKAGFYQRALFLIFFSRISKRKKKRKEGEHLQEILCVCVWCLFY